MAGLLTENGPFVWLPGNNKPIKNPWSWHLLTNMVWIDQPITVGYSTGNVTIQDEDDLAEQFMGFWKNFVDTFALQGYKVYIAAESYGGYYGPYISSHFLDANDTEYFELSGLMIFDGIMFDQMLQFNVPLPAYVDANRNLFGLPDDVLAKVSAAAELCGYKEYIEKYLTFPPTAPQPRFPPGVSSFPNGSYIIGSSPNLKYPECAVQDYIFAQWVLQNPCSSAYSINAGCPLPSSPLVSVTGESNETPYLDRGDVKKVLHAPDVKWVMCKQNVFDVPYMDMSLLPGVQALPHVIERTGNVILAQGSMDALLPTNGVLLGIQNMTWNGVMGFHSRPQDPFYVPRYGLVQDQATYYGHERPASSGVVGTSHHERGLTFVVTQLAGHMGPYAAPSAAFRQLEKLLGRVPNLHDTAPFTLPELKDVKQDSELGKGSVHIPCLRAGC